jgi:hypothetical protein
MFSFLGNLFNGAGALRSVENIAKEFIDTPGEKASARALFVKTLDPNGLSRRMIANRISVLYVVYVMVAMILLLAQAFNIGDAEGVAKAITSISGLFVPVTTMFTMIVSASFGVQLSNSIKGH